MCVEQIVEISNISDGDSRQNVLTDKYLDFLNDNLKIIKVAAYKLLGSFIATLKSVKVNEKLFQAYLNMPDYSINNLAKDNEVIIYHCLIFKIIDYLCVCL